jgi:hypothetical protein
MSPSLTERHVLVRLCRFPLRDRRFARILRTVREGA